ncbi:helix-turn-helix domain-containing protein [Sphingobium phenoxybenzoativorans]|uniref:helix-turn-helix domain-containing protein n=1 Tax=Sphingobium phenoxybenzoativorans TaxID=1592790 RepID=UPI000872F4C5|nr:helix-turn-helix transcriptional regulator [Sphingobium phenoxybenzoativorans]
MDLKDALSINLLKIRNETGRTQEEMAHLLGISARYLGSIERGKVSPSVTLLGKFADALHASPCDLLVPPNARAQRTD